MIKKQNKTILIAIDIGNTSMSVGIFLGRRFVKKTRIPTVSKEQKIYTRLSRLLKPYICCDIKVIISSVVPCVTKNVKHIFTDKFKLRPIIVGKHVKAPIKNLYKTPAQVGQDRLVNAFACKQIYGSPAIIIDFGTATTFDYVNKRGEYEGGIITPGVEITINSLAENTALLPKIKLKKPQNLIGKDTSDSIRSGVLNGLACMCDGLIEKIKKDRKSSPIVVATGGLARVFCHYSKHINKVDQDLTLKGLYLIFSKKSTLPLDI